MIGESKFTLGQVQRDNGITEILKYPQTNHPDQHTYYDSIFNRKLQKTLKFFTRTPSAGSCSKDLVSKIKRILDDPEYVEKLKKHS